MARLQRWVASRVAARPDPQERHLLHRYGDWYLIRRLRARTRGAAASYHQVVGVQQRLRFAIGFLDDLRARGLTLATLTQPNLEAWLADEASLGKEAVGGFLRWAARHHLTTVTVPSRIRKGPTTAIQTQERWDQARRLLGDDTIKTADRVAGLLVLLYGQRAASLIRLTLAVPRPPTWAADQRLPAGQTLE